MLTGNCGSVGSRAALVSQRVDYPGLIRGVNGVNGNSESVIWYYIYINLYSLCVVIIL